MASSKKWATLISSIASIIYFLIIILQVPLFRIPCRIGTCTTPLVFTSSQLIASELFPSFVVKALLYPGAAANAICRNKPIPSFNNLIKFYKFASVRKGQAATDLQHIEVLVGSYFAVAGALLGLIRPRKMSLFGILLVQWGLIKLLFFEKHKHGYTRKGVYIYPAMLITVISAFLSIKKDVRKIIHSTRRWKIVKSLKNYSKEKFK